MNGSAAPTAVELIGVDKRFDDVHALSGIELTLDAGEFVSLIGPSGCGKSTLLRVVADLEQPSAGEVRVGGKPARRARLDQDYGIAFQQSGLLEWRTVAENVELPLHVHGVGKAERRARAAELLELVGLTDFAGSRPAQLSGGMQQRVAIARALAPAAEAPADGRAVRRVGRDDARTDAGRAAAHRARERRGGAVRHALHPGGRRVVRPRGGDVAAPGTDHRGRRGAPTRPQRRSWSPTTSRTSARRRRSSRRSRPCARRCARAGHP